MAIPSGTRLGVYEIVALLGAGGMGEVYRAQDTKLGRVVALKVLPESLVADADRIARFEREARVLAPLVHANIAALYGMEQHDRRHCLVLELVEGETLAERLRRGPLKVADALAVAGQIGEALEAAHEKGVVHRDLKPANVKITPDGVVKVLDFGLAKAMETAPASQAPGVTNSPTLSMMATQAGIVLGTAAYMSPEQAKGAAADHRSDVFSFGVVLYEMLTCRTPFQGETAPEIMASVLVRDPDLTTLPAGIPARLRDLIKRCLEKSPKKRWQAIGDVRVELEAIAAAPHDTPTGSTVAARPLWQRALTLGVVAVAAAAVASAATWYRLQPQPAAVVRFTVPLPEAQQFGGLARTFIALSPDGSRLVYVTQNQRLVMRSLDSLDLRPVTGLGAITTMQPVFSPDGEWLAFWTIGDATLRKMALAGGAPMTLAKTEVPFGISWYRNSIVYAVAKGIMRIPDTGGEPELIIPAQGGALFASPQIVDDGRAVLFAVTSDTGEARWDRADIVLQPIGSTERTVVVRGGSAPRLLPTGHLLYMSASSLNAVRFDAATGRAGGTPVSLVDGIMRSEMTGSGMPQLAISENGSLAFVPGSAGFSRQRTLAVIGADGRVDRLNLPPNTYETPRVSPDGRLLAVASDDGTQAVVWVYDLQGKGLPRRLTFGGKNRSPAWTPDSKSIAFQSDREGDAGIFVQPADGGSAVRLTTAEKDSQHWPSSWSPDGRTLAFTISRLAEDSIWAVSMTGDRKAVRLVTAAGRQVLPVFSQDGRWLAYVSTELGGTAYQIFIVPYPQTTDTKYQVTTSASSGPVWAARDRRIFHAFRNVVSVTDVQMTPGFAIGGRTALQTQGTLTSPPAIRNYDVSADGTKVYAIVESADTGAGKTASAPQINIVLNWFEELKARVR